MSANNQIIIIKNNKTKRKQFEVHENLCVDNNFQSSKKTLLKKFKELKEAMEYAQEYCNEYPYVEYGIHMEGCSK